MLNQTRINRRDFLKLNAMLGSVVAASVMLPVVAAAKSIPVPTTPSNEFSESNVLDLNLAQVPTRFGTPTDIAATWVGEAWAVDAEGVIRKFDRAHQAWKAEASANANVNEDDFPVGSTIYMARWGRPSGPNQMLMVLAGVG